MEKDPQSHAIIGAAMEVHRELGFGFLEAVYQCALALEFQERAIPFKAEVSLPIRYKGKLLTCGYRADFVAIIPNCRGQRGRGRHENHNDWSGRGILNRTGAECGRYPGGNVLFRSFPVG